MLRTVFGAVGGAVIISAALAVAAPAAEQVPPKHPLAQEHPIVFDARGILPPIAWSVPGVTEPLQSVRDRMMTDRVTTLQLRPGKYMYMTTIFSFEFTVSLDGLVDYSKMVQHCVDGRGTAKVIVKCRRIGNLDSTD